jgi:hypothetical protein
MAVNLLNTQSMAAGDAARIQREQRIGSSINAVRYPTKVPNMVPLVQHLQRRLASPAELHCATFGGLWESRYYNR